MAKLAEGDQIQYIREDSGGVLDMSMTLDDGTKTNSTIIFAPGEVFTVSLTPGEQNIHPSWANRLCEDRVCAKVEPAKPVTETKADAAPDVKPAKSDK